MSEGEQKKGMNKVVLILAGLILVAVVAMFALRSGGGPAGELAGTYVAEGQEGMTLKLSRDGAYTATIEEFGVSVTIKGTYHREGDYVYFYVQGQPNGKAKVQDGTLINRGEGITWIKEGRTTSTTKVPEVKPETESQFETPSLPTQELSPSEIVEAFWTAIQEKNFKLAVKYFSPEISISAEEFSTLASEESNFQNIAKVEVLSEKIYEEQGRARVNFKLTYKDETVHDGMAYLGKEYNTWKIYQF